MKTDYKRVYPHKDFKAKLEITGTREEFQELVNALGDLPSSQVVNEVYEQLIEILYWFEDVERMP